MTPARMFFLIVSTLALLILFICLNAELFFAVALIVALLVVAGVLIYMVLGFLWVVSTLLTEEFNKKWPQFQTK